MARTEIAVQSVSLAGVTPAFAAAFVDGNMFKNDGNVIIEVKNASASPVTVTIQTPAKVGGVDLAEIVVTVPATNGDKVIGPFDPSLFNQAGGMVYLDTSAQASVTIAVLRLP